MLQWLMTDNIQLNQIDAEDPEVRNVLKKKNGITSNCLLNYSSSTVSFCPLDHRLQHAARHRLLVRPAQSVFTRG